MISPEYVGSSPTNVAHVSCPHKFCQILHRRECQPAKNGNIHFDCSQCGVSQRVLLRVHTGKSKLCFSDSIGAEFILCLKCIRRARKPHTDNYPKTRWGEELFECWNSSYCGYCNRNGPYFKESDDCVMLGRHNDDYNYDGICMGCLDLFEEILLRAYE